MFLSTQTHLPIFFNTQLTVQTPQQTVILFGGGLNCRRITFMVGVVVTSRLLFLTTTIFHMKFYCNYTWGTKCAPAR